MPGCEGVLRTTTPKLRHRPGDLWTAMFAFKPPPVAGADSNPRANLAAMHAIGERRIAIMALKKAPQVVSIGKSAGLDADKFKRFHLAPAPAARAAPPVVAGLFANLEFRVAGTGLAERSNGPWHKR
jgi:flavin reductase (DIM6/NTAB) family NADH-FMN oxidoreductase RutF